METTTHNHPHNHESTMMHTHTTSDTTTHAHNHNHHTTTMHTHTAASDADDTTEQGGEEGTGSLEEVGSGGHEGHEGHNEGHNEGHEEDEDGQGGTMDPCQVDISTLLC